VQVVYGKNTLINWELACVYALISLVFSIFGSYAIALRRGAEALDTILHEELEERDTSIQRLTTKLKEAERDPAEEYHYRTAQDILGNFPDTAKAILRYVWTHEKLFAGDPIAQLGKALGIDTNLILSILNDLSAKSLLTKNWDMIGNHSVTWWGITSGYKNALGKILF